MHVCSDQYFEGFLKTILQITGMRKGRLLPHLRNSTVRSFSRIDFCLDKTSFHGKLLPPIMGAKVLSLKQILPETRAKTLSCLAFVGKNGSSKVFTRISMRRA